MRFRPLKCPACGLTFEYREVAAVIKETYFRCPICSKRIRVSRLFDYTMTYSAFGTSFAITWLLGIREPLKFMLSVTVLWAGFLLVFGMLLRIVIAVPLSVYEPPFTGLNPFDS